MELSSDSFSVYCDCDCLEVGRKHFHTSVKWNISRINNRILFQGDHVVSPTFQCATLSWNLKLYPKGRLKLESSSQSRRPVLYINIADIFLTGSCTTVSKTTFLNEMGTTVSEIPSVKHVFNLQREQKVVYCDFGGVISELLRKQNSLTICFKIRIEKNTVSGLFMKQNIFKDETIPMKKEAGTNTLHEDLNIVDDNPPADGYENMAILCTDLEALHKNPRFADVVLKLGEHEFPAHKVILASRSKVFKAMFEHDTKEKQQAAVTLVEMEIGTVKDMLRYIYCGKVRPLSPEEALKLYVAADRYDLQRLVLECRKIMLNGLSIDNICEISAVADLHNDQLLVDAVKTFLRKDAKTLLRTDKWVMFSKENPLLALNLVQSVILSS